MRIFLIVLTLSHLSLCASPPQGDESKNLPASFSHRNSEQQPVFPQNLRGTLFDPVRLDIEKLRSWAPGCQKRRGVYDILVKVSDLKEDELRELASFYVERLPGCRNDNYAYVKGHAYCIPCASVFFE